MAENPDFILIQSGPGEIRLALVEKEQAVQFIIDRGDGVAGDIALARIVAVLPQSRLAFADYGAARPGLMAFRGQKEGDSLIVQIKAPPRGGKGAELEPKPALTGRLIVYTPHHPGVNISRKLAEPVRARLKTLLAELAEPDEGILVRSDAERAEPERIAAELAQHRARWRGIESAAKAGKAPAWLYAPSPIEKMAALYPDAEILVDDSALLAQIIPFAPKARLYRDGPTFSLYGADEALEEALAPTILMPKGGAISFRSALGFTIIDIDAGGLPPIDANLAAAPIIARHLRLRNLSGHILIDAIPIKNQPPKAMIEAISEKIAEDPVPTHMFGATRLGLIEMTRQRNGPSLGEIFLCDPTPEANPTSLALEGLSRLTQESLADQSRRFRLKVSSIVMTEIRARPTALAWVEKKLGQKPVVIEDPDLSSYETEIVP